MRNYKVFRIKLAGLISLIFLLVGSGYQCSPNSNEADKTSPSGSLTSLAQKQRMEEDLKMKEDAKNRYQSVLETLDRESSKLGISSLRTSEPDSHTEIRIWVGFGLTYSRCVVLKKLQETTTEATYVGPSITAGRAARDAKGNVILPKRPLGAPRSGWSSFDEFLKQQGIDSPIRLSLDDRYLPAPDAETIVIEAKSKDTYSMVFFSLYTTSEDGQKAIKVCRRIGEEFGVTMGCT